MQTVMVSGGLYDKLEELERLLSEYNQAKISDRLRAHTLKHEIIDKIKEANLDKEIKISLQSTVHSSQNKDYAPSTIVCGQNVLFEEVIKRTHEVLTRLRTSLIPDGMHIFGENPKGEGKLEFINSILKYDSGDGLSIRTVLFELMGEDLDFALKNPSYMSKIHKKTYSELIKELDSLSLEFIRRFLNGEEVTFEGSQEDAAKIEEMLEKYDINPEDFVKSNDNQYQDIDYTEIKKELADASNYPVTLQEEEQFFSNLEKIYSEERFILVKNYLKEFKSLYPSGYFTLIKVTQKTGYNFFELVEEEKEKIPSSINEFLWTDFNSSYSSDIDTLVHELTHAGPAAYFDTLNEKGFSGEYGSGYYMIGNLIVLIEKDRMLFFKTEIFQDIENPDDFDIIYLSPDEPGHEIDFTNILDEINAYTVSVKCEIAVEELISHDNALSVRLGLLKQMSHLELYLKRCYEKYPEDWEYITNHKGVAFLIMKLWLEAERIESAVKDDLRFNKDSEPVSEFVYNPDNYEIIERFFNDSQIMAYRDKTFQEASEELDRIKVYDINS